MRPIYASLEVYETSVCFLSIPPMPYVLVSDLSLYPSLSAFSKCSSLFLYIYIYIYIYVCIYNVHIYIYI